MTVTTVTRLVPRLTEQERFMVLRRRAGVTQPELAARTGIKQSRISAWERECAALDPERVQALWEAMNSAAAEKVS